MPAYNFQKQFAPAVESGQKRQTIRALGKRRHARSGEHVQLYTGMRTRACRKLLTPDPVCTGNHELVLEGEEKLQAYVDGFYVFDMDGFARADGFKDAQEMRDWFKHTHGLPFKGVLIQWEHPAKEPA